MPRKHASTLAVIDMIAAERIRQMESEGFTAAHDDQHADGVLARAGACYAMNAGKAASYEERHGIRMLAQDYMRSPMPADWPWALDWWKPKTQMQDLVRAAALLVAEIERQIRRDGATAGTPELPPPPSAAEVAAMLAPPARTAGTAFASPPDNRLVQPAVAEAYTHDRRFAQTSEARAIIEGAPSDLRARLAEACAKAGFTCRFLPARHTSSLCLTLAAPPGLDLKAAMENVASLGSLALIETHASKDHADPALTALVHDPARPVVVGQAQAALQDA